MADELQSLLDRIQTEAVDTAEEEASRIVSTARQRAGEIVEEAQADAASRLEEAETQAMKYQERSTRALEQAVRDLLLTVGKSVGQIVSGLVRTEVEERLDPQFLRELIERIVTAYIEHGDRAGDLRVTVNPETEADIVRYFHGRYADWVTDGFEIAVDGGFTCMTI